MVRALGCARSPSGVELSLRPEGVLQWRGSKKHDGETASPMKRGKCMAMGVFGGESGRCEYLRAKNCQKN